MGTATRGSLHTMGSHYLESPVGPHVFDDPRTSLFEINNGGEGGTLDFASKHSSYLEHFYENGDTALRPARDHS